MSDVNSVVISGRLTRDPVSKAVGEHTVSEFSLAVNKGFGDKEETSFVDVSVWNRQAEFVNKYLKKGSGVVAYGRLKQDSWQDKETGKNRSKLFLAAENIEFLPSSGGKKAEAEEVVTEQSSDEQLPF